MKPHMGLQPIQILGQHPLMTVQLQQALKLLQLSRLELEQELTQQITDNPLLEGPSVEEQDEGQETEEPDPERPDSDAADDAPDDEKDDGPPADEPWEPCSGDREDYPAFERVLASRPSLADHLSWQLALSGLSDAEKAIGRLIIGNLDEDGYLAASLEELAVDAGVSVGLVERVLRCVQTFDPAGIAARDLRECLLIQLSHLDGDPIRAGGEAGKAGGTLRGSLVEAVIARHLNDLEKRRYEAVAKALTVTVQAVQAAARVIERLEPKPGRPYAGSENYAVVPEVFVIKEEGEWRVLLNDDGLPRLRLSPEYRRLMASRRAKADEARAYLEKQFHAAQWLIRSLAQRNRTILAVVKSLVKFQRPFFEQGVAALKPLVLQQVADDVGVHESTVSRATSNKYLACPHGLYELKFLFSPGVPRADRPDESVSTASVKELVKRIVAEEDPGCPLMDEEIMTRLRRDGITIARRTIAKYRTELGIPPANRRGERPGRGPAEVHRPGVRQDGS